MPLVYQSVPKREAGLVLEQPPNSTVGAVPAAKQRNNALWTATRYELSFQKGDLILWC
jgi:hypothetical protein